MPPTLPRRRLPLALAALWAGLLAGPAAGQSPTPGALPQPVVPLTVGANLATQGHVTGAVAGARLDLDQTSTRAIVDWQSFHVGRDAAVVIRQPDSASALLNRIQDGVPSQILGRISANGQVYLVNPNGIVFGRGAQIDANAIVASTLSITPDTFLAGPLASGGVNAAFEGTGGAIVVDAGATLRSAQGGQVWLLGPTVDVRAGATIDASGGHAILAAGQKVYLAASNDPALRGVLVEVDGGGTVLQNGAILANEGRATLMGLAVNQSGRVTATTSVTANGIVELLARDSTVFDNASGRRIATRAGTIVFEGGSRTEILPDTSGRTSTDQQSFQASRLDVMSRRIEVRSGAAIVAPGASVTMTALAAPNDPQLTIPGSARNDARMHVDRDATIDLSGTKNVSVPVTRNFVTFELRGNELKDAPAQKSGALRGQSVTVDLRSGTTLADASAVAAQIGRTAAERTGTGGTLTLASEGDVILREGSRIDVSGGSLAFTDGFASLTRLVTASGQVVSITDARADVVYAGILGPSAAGPLYQPGYVQGLDAGTVRIVARQAVLDGALEGRALNSALTQSDPGRRALGGRFILGDAGQNASDVEGADFRTGSIVLGPRRTVLPADFTADGDAALLPASVTVSTELASRGGFARFELYSDGAIDLPAEAALALPPGGSASLVGRSVNLAGAITAPGGTIAITSRRMFRESSGADQPVTLQPGATLSTAGLWVNESRAIRDAAFPRFIDGGSVTLSSRGAITLSAGTTLDVSGGALLPLAGVPAEVRAGRAGSVALTGNTENSIAVDLPHPYAMRLDGALLGHALSGGGLLSITAGSVALGTPSTGARGELVLPAAFLSRGGFRDIRLTGIDGLRTDGTLTATLESFILATNPLGIASGASLRPLARVVTQTDLRLRDPVNITLSAPSPYAGVLDVLAGTRLATDPGGRIALDAGRQLTVLGRIAAPAGTIAITVTGNPTAADDRGFVAGQSLWLGAGAVLDARGAAVIYPDSADRLAGQVLPGGTVRLQASKGFVVAQTGATIDVSGTSGVLDLPAATGIDRRAVASRGGAITIQAREAILFDGTLRGAPGGSGALAGGEVRFILDRQERPGIVPPGGYPTAPLTLALVANGDSVPAGLRVGEALPAGGDPGRSALAVTTLVSGGFDAISLRARDALVADGDVTLAARGSVTLDAPALGAVNGGTLRVSADRVALGNTDARTQAIRAPVAGTGAIDVTASTLIDLAGGVTTTGVDRVSLATAGDLRLQGVLTDDLADTRLRGRFATPGSLTLRAGRVYPTTLTEYAIDAAAVTLDAAGPAVGGTPLSAGGALTIRADAIAIGGTVLAPNGSLTLTSARAGSGTIDVRGGAVLSVAGGTAVVPFGRVENGNTWVYDLGDRRRVITATPAKRITLEAGAVTLAAGATVDLSPGGELQGVEFIPGPGGSRDLLGAAGTFAIVPTLGTPYGPNDWETRTAGDGLATDAAIRLAEIPGVLEGGIYALLPARYASLPGAFLVTRLESGRDRLPTLHAALADGSRVVAGQAASAASGRLLEDRTATYQLIPAARLPAFAEYTVTSAQALFAAAAARAGVDAPRGPADAGQLAIVASGSLTLGADLRFGTVSGAGRGGWLDIAAPAIAITADGAGPTGSLALRASTLSTLGVQSLLIGGTRETAEGGGVTIRTVATNVTVGPDVRLTADELLLVAADRVTITDNATLAAEGSGAASDRYRLAGDGALLRLSGGVPATVTRSGTVGSAGTITVGEWARLAGRSLLLDAANDTAVATSAELDADAVSLSAHRVTIGASAPDGLSLTAALLATVSRAGSLTLRSYTSLDFAGDVTLGSLADPVNQLTLDTASLRGDGTVTLTGGRITLTNSGATANAIAPGSGTLTLRSVAGDLVRSGGDIAVSGFAQTTWSAAGDVRFEGRGVTAVAGDLELAAPRITGGDAFDQTLSVAGTMRTGGAPLPVPADRSPPAPGLAGRLTLQGGAVALGGTVVLPSGTLGVTATGTGPALELVSGGVLDVGGRPTAFHDATRGTPGGSVRLAAMRGDLTLAAGSRVRFEGGTGDQSAGRLDVLAPEGAVTLAGVLDATTGTGAAVSLDARQAPDLAPLAALLRRGGIDGMIALRAREGDLSLAAADKLAAQRIALTADAGSITVRGRLDATGADAGEIALWSGRGIELAETARMQATGIAHRGATVDLGATSGAIALAPGSEIDVHGPDGAATGAVRLRVTRGSADVPVSASGTVTGATVVTVEAVRVYENVASISPALRTTIATDTATFMAGAPAIVAQLAAGTAAPWRVRSGVELRATGDMTLPSDWSLFSAARPGGEPGVLTLRAAGNLQLNGSLSDGFATAAPAAALQSSASWAYRLVAGADAASADPLVVGPAAAGGDVVVGAGRLVRTGTGDIDVTAARDIRLTNATSVIYTAGTPTATPADFTNPRAATGTVPNFPEDGGDVRLRSGGSIVAAPSGQYASDWLHRQGRLNAAGQFDATNPQTSWWVAFADFRQGVGALGGGRVVVDAAGDIVDLGVSVPTTGRLTGTQPSTGTLVIAGGGDIAMRAGGDLVGGSVFVADGTAQVAVAGAIRAADTDSAAPVVALAGSGQSRLVAGRGLTLEGAYSPTAIPQSRNNIANVTEARASFFLGYGAEARIDAVALAGDITLANDTQRLANLATGLRIPTGGSPSAAFALYPGSLTVQAHTGAVAVPRELAMAPSARGTLEVLAATDVRIDATLYMSDHDPALLPGIRLPDRTYLRLSEALHRQGYSGLAAHAATPLHSGDSEPVRIYAATGDLRGPSPDGGAFLGVFPKPVVLRAAGDVRDANFYAQNLRTADVSLVAAGRDVVYTVARDEFGRLRGNGARMELGGPGRLMVLAGRDLDLANSAGLLTRGNLVNPALPGEGASILAAVGLGRDAAGALQVPDGAGMVEALLRGDGADAQAARTRLGAYLDGLGLPSSDPVAALEALPADRRLPYLADELFRVLRASGRVAAAGDTAAFGPGFDAIRALFPSPGTGDARLTLSQIKTERGGAIDLLAPGGSVDVGLAVPPADLGKSASQLGIVTVAGGDVRGFVNGSFRVNQSRVFTLGGGDIVLWASTGDIDAGRGSKLASYAPPPTIIVRADGTVETDLQAAVAGSGIGVLLTRAGIEPGSVDLYAPAGTVDAGDAGIIAAGDLYIGGLVVVCTAGCSAGGTATGVPLTAAPDTAAVSAVQGTATDAVATAANTARELAPSRPEPGAVVRPYYLRVEVLDWSLPGGSR